MYMYIYICICCKKGSPALLRLWPEDQCFMFDASHREVSHRRLRSEVQKALAQCLSRSSTPESRIYSPIVCLGFRVRVSTPQGALLCRSTIVCLGFRVIVPTPQAAGEVLFHVRAKLLVAD